MNWISKLRWSGIAAAFAAAVLFGCGTPIAKLLLNNVSSWLLAGLLYFGSGVGLTLYRRVTRAQSVRLSRHEIGWLAGAIGAGGVIAPVLLMFGLNGMPASAASLLLNSEGVFTTLLAWFAFKENFDHRIALGMLVIVLGSLILSWPTNPSLPGAWPALAILTACLAWGIDNNLTRKVSLADATWIASVKGFAAGSINLVLAFALGASLPRWPYVAAGTIVGFLSYGVSLALFVIGLRHLGTARTAAYFSIAPFLGALLAVAMGEPITLQLLLAGILMAVGICLHLTEQHEHQHVHEALEHEHEHLHDEHHRHDHDGTAQSGIKHSHRHRHPAIVHTHSHFPDVHHRHEH